MDLVGTLEQAAGDAVREEEQEPNIALKSQTYHPSYPIDNYEGDLVLLSKDGVLFRVHSIILKIASSFFREMLEIPRSSSESAGDPIPMEENAAIVAIMLDAIYPNTDIILRDVATIRNVELYAEELTAAADKYDVPVVSATVRSALFAGTGKVPSLKDRWSAIRLYDLAHKHGWTEEKRIASSWTLHCCLTSPEAISELQLVSAHTILQLQYLHRKRIDLYKASLKSIATGKACRDVWETDGPNLYNCNFETSDAWKLFMYEVQEELTTNPLGSRLLKNEKWGNSGYAQIFEILHEDTGCPKLRTLRLPRKSKFITAAQKALQALPTFI